MITRDQLKKGEKYSYQDIKHLLPNKKSHRPTHARANTIEEMTEENRNMFLSLTKQIQEKFPDAVVYAGGSRINGNWDESSDYDLNVYLPQSQWNEISKMEFDVKVDLHLKVPQGVLIRQIV